MSCSSFAFFALTLLLPVSSSSTHPILLLFPLFFFLLVFSRCSDSDSNDGDAGKGKFFVFFFLVLHLSSFFLLLHPQVPAFSPLVHLYFFSLSLLSLLESLSLCLHSFLCVDSADDHGFADLRAQLFHTPLSSSSPVHGADG